MKNNLELNVDELMEKVRVEVANRKSLFTINQSISNEINVLQANDFIDTFDRIESLLNDSELCSQVPTKLPEKLNKFPFSIGIINKVILKIYGLIFKKQMVVNRNLIQALRESLQLNQSLISKLDSTEQRIDSTEQRIDSTEQRIDSTEQRIDSTEQRIDST
ncbi:coiled-coil domain-containing protein, partial [Nostoc sp.]|uniref:coiled-coil domain-containing protein n=1 Tax=Nostoc sp. TaxID=1180 RepID=UPI003B62C46E